MRSRSVGRGKDEWPAHAARFCISTQNAGATAEPLKSRTIWNLQWCCELQQFFANGDSSHGTELCVFHMGLKVAGQLDALFINDARQLLLIDWKRCKNVTFDCCWRTLKPPLEHLGDCNVWVYSLQLNMYRWILESAYGLMVGDRMYLAVVHTDLSKPRLVKIPHLEEEVEAVIADQLDKGLAVSREEPDEV